VEPVTHLLTSLALARGWARRERQSVRRATAILVTAGLAPDIDFLSRAAGPAIYFRLHRSAAHSLAGAAALTFLVAALFWRGRPTGKDRGLPAMGYGTTAALAAVAIAAHLLLDLGTSYGVRLLWPFSERFYAWNLWAEADPWILLGLAAGILLPALLGLVTSEIGARSAGRASRGAWAALALLALYGAGRGVLHARARALLASRLYQEAAPRVVDAFPEPRSPFVWRGVVETADTIQTLELSLPPGTGGGAFVPEYSRIYFKPRPSPALERARATALAQEWLAGARFPFANVAETENGFRVEFRDLSYLPGAERYFMPVAVIRLDEQLKVVSERMSFGVEEKPGD